MLEKTKKSPVYKEVYQELIKQEPSFNGEIYNFDNLLKQEKTLKIIEFVKEQLILILENTDGKKIAIQLIKGEQNYFASVININSHKNMFDTENKKEFLFDKISNFGTIKTKQKINLLSSLKTEERNISLNFFIGKIDGKVSYIISNPQGYEYFLVNNYNLKSNLTNKKLPSINNFLLEKAS